MRSVPTFQTTPLNRARHASEAQFPGLWKGVRGTWQPGLGPTGDVLRDLSGHGNNGALVNMVPSDWVTSEGRSALHFDTDDNRIEMGTPASLADIEEPNGMSISSWIRLDSTSQDVGIVSKANSPGAGSGQWQFRVGFGETLGFRKSFSDTILVSLTNEATIVAEQWHHVVMTWDGSADATTGVRFWLDGDEDTTRNTVQDGVGTKDSDAGSRFVIGSRQSREYPGNFDDVIVYARILFSSEAQLLSQLGRGGWLAKRRRVFAKAPAAPPVGISVGRHYPRGVGRGIGRGVAV